MKTSIIVMVFSLCVCFIDIYAPEGDVELVSAEQAQNASLYHGVGESLPTKDPNCCTKMFQNYVTNPGARENCAYLCGFGVGTAGTVAAYKMVTNGAVVFHIEPNCALTCGVLTYLTSASGGSLCRPSCFNERLIPESKVEQMQKRNEELQEIVRRFSVASFGSQQQALMTSTTSSSSSSTVEACMSSLTSQNEQQNTKRAAALLSAAAEEREMK